MEWFTKKQRAEIYLKCAQEEFKELGDGTFFILTTAFKDYTFSVRQKAWREALPELNLMDVKHRSDDRDSKRDIKNVRVLAYLFAYQMTLK